MLQRTAAIFAIFTAALLSRAAEPVNTSLTVRVKAHDAKFVGSTVGGIKVIARNADTGAILAEGMIEGGTGDTKLIMQQPHSRGQRLADDKAAHFTATIPLAEPTLVRVEIHGPKAVGTMALAASKTVCLLPGHDIDGDGLVFDLPGAIVHIITPSPNQVFKPGDTVPIDVHVAMMCGCPLKPDFIWDANKFEIKATIKGPQGNVLKTVPLRYAGEASLFQADFTPPSTGGYKLIVTAAEDESNNFGFAVSGFAVKE